MATGHNAANGNDARMLAVRMILYGHSVLYIFWPHNSDVANAANGNRMKDINLFTDTHTHALGLVVNIFGRGRITSGSKPHTNIYIYSYNIQVRVV